MAKEAVHECFEGLKARQIPKAIREVELPEVSWTDGTPLNETEVKHLITLLREEGPDATSQILPNVVAALDQASMLAWSKAALAAWEEIGSPAGQKWMLFQYRTFATDDDLEKLCDAHNWTGLASMNKWARANWYLSVIASRGPLERSIHLFFELLCHGKLNGTVQKSSRKFLESFAKTEGTNTQDLLEARDLIGVFPDQKLPFIPGQDSVTNEEGRRYVVGIHRGELSFRDDESHKLLLMIPDGLSGTDQTKLGTWQRSVHEQVMRWGGYLHYSMTLGRTFTLEKIQKEWFADAVASGVLASLLWRNESDGQVLRLEEDGAFDVNYDVVELAPQAKLGLVQLTELDDATRSAWYEHLSDNEMLLPFDVLERETYIAKIKAALEADFVEREDEEYDNVIQALSDYDYHGSDAHDGGVVYESYKTFPRFNARVFLEHTGYDIVEGGSMEYPGNVNNISFRDLFGTEKSIQEVYISVLAEAAVDLMKIKHLDIK